MSKFPPLEFKNDGRIIAGEGLTVEVSAEGISSIHFDAFDELEYLQYFYDAVRPALGPADDDIIYMIQEAYESETNKRVPEELRMLRDEEG